jgi:hypothetical protein
LTVGSILGVRETGELRFNVSWVDIGGVVTREWGFGAKLLQSMHTTVQRDICRENMAAEAFVYIHAVLS